jgi:GTP-binding protein HflX
VVQRLGDGSSSVIEELKGLAEAAGYTVISSLVQRRAESPAFQIGKGKIRELAHLVDEVDAEKVIFDQQLKPVQSYNIAKAVGVEAIDRFQLILEIFASRAATSEAKLQIQLASLRYQLPRARESVRLARMGEQPGFLGLGRYEVDVHHENIKRQIARIRRDLQKIREKRSLHRSRRLESGFALVSLAGYTGAGKTTLFNAFTKESKPVNLGLFTTLTTTTRAVVFEGKKTLLTDTVGFIDRLPIILVEAFKSTLEETQLADVILLVVDFHEPLIEVKRKMDSCSATLKEIGANSIPVITVLNKVDQIPPEELQQRLRSMKRDLQNPVTVSALHGTNLKALRRKVSEQLKDYLTARFVLSYKGATPSFISALHRQIRSLEVTYRGDDVQIVLSAQPGLMEKLKREVNRRGGIATILTPRADAEHEVD